MADRVSDHRDECVLRHVKSVGLILSWVTPQSQSGKVMTNPPSSAGNQTARRISCSLFLLESEVPENLVVKFRS